MAWLRLHWYWPARRKSPGEDGAKRTPPRRLRRFLERIAPTWAASPWRRLAQTACFLIFLWLFFYACWPYSARPAPEYSGWVPVGVDTLTGQIDLAVDHPPQEPIAQDAVLYVVDPANGQLSLLGVFRATRSVGKELTLLPFEPLSAAQLDRLSTSLGPWSLRVKDPNQWPSHFADDLSAKQKLPASTFLAIDPLVSISAAIASRAWIWSLGWASVVLMACLVIPRGFCGYVCPLGTLIDLFDWTIGRRISRFRLSREGWWAWLRYVFLAAVVTASLCGVLIAGFVSAIPLITRGMAFVLAPLQTGLLHGWRQVPPMHTEHYVSIGLVVLVFVLGLLGPRFWCRFLCPTGAVFSLGNLLRFHQRHVTDDCGGCGRCAVHCPFDAVGPDFATRTSDCAFCQTCGGVCPAEAIRFGSRWQGPCQESDAESTPSTPGSAWRRRRFLGAGIGLTAGCAGGIVLAAAAKTLGVGRGSSDQPPPVRPPGSLPEPDFLKTCVRCGECLRACPNDALQPVGWDHGLDGLWTPRVVADWSGCEPSCNRCGQVCPTGAIRALPMEEKRFARQGLAVVDKQTCLPYAQETACQLCVEACRRAGYEAIEFVRTGTEMDASGNPIADTGFLAPVVRAESCVGCGLCQTRCHSANVRQQALLARSAIRVEAGEGREDRLRSGSYRALRQAEEERRKNQSPSPVRHEGNDLPGLPK